MKPSERLIILDLMLEDMRYEADQCEWPHIELELRKKIEALQHILDFYEENA